MDYEVYLVSRMQEEWHHLVRGEPSGPAGADGRAARLNHRAIVGGQAKSGRIIVGVPAIMHLIGPSNWAIPAWIDRLLPSLSVDAEEPSPSEGDLWEQIPVA